VRIRCKGSHTHERNPERRSREGAFAGAGQSYSPENRHAKRPEQESRLRARQQEHSLREPQARGNGTKSFYHQGDVNEKSILKFGRSKKAEVRCSNLLNALSEGRISFPRKMAHIATASRLCCQLTPRVSFLLSNLLRHKSHGGGADSGFVSSPVKV